ncbi:MAG: hypothetical protein BWK80_53490 [Desulfobacteraceae bacterium IS3]|nr:MAG: hypothetical protein BWK80_53490 [Desulfobacteraceae bacterium IS3]
MIQKRSPGDTDQKSSGLSVAPEKEIKSRFRLIFVVGIIEQAKEKEAGIEPVEIFNILKSFPEDAISLIKWAIPIDADKFISELNQIAADIFQGNRNSLKTL